MTKRSLIGLIVAVFTFVGLMIVATFYDLEISIALANADSVFGQFFNYLGEFPAWAGIPIGLLILFRGAKGLKYEKILRPILLVGTAVGFFLLADFLMEEMTADLKWKYLYVVLFALTMTGFSLLAVKNVSDETFKKLTTFAILLLAVIAVSQGITTVLKYIWSRQRFRNLQVGNVAFGTAEGFSPWYLPTIGKHDPNHLYPDVLGGKDIDGAYRSFPSGHTTAAAASFAIIILPETFKKLKKYQVLFYALPIAYTVLVAVSRIVNRAHYLSDVTVGGFMTVGVAFLLKYIIKKVWTKYRLATYELFLEAEESND